MRRLLVLSLLLIGCQSRPIEPTVPGQCFKIAYTQGGATMLVKARKMTRISDTHIIVQEITSLDMDGWSQSRPAQLDIANPGITIAEGYCF